MRMLSFPELKPEKGIGYTRVHLARLEQAGKFPRRVPYGDNRVGWVEEEIEAWLAEKAAARAIPKRGKAKRATPSSNRQVDARAR